MSKTRKQIQEELNLPPIPMPPTRDSKHRRDRARIRLEVTTEHAEVFLGVLGQELNTLDIESEEFATLFRVYGNIQAQINKAKLGENDADTE